MRLARLLPLFVVLLLVSCFSAQADEPLPDRPDVRSASSTHVDLDIEALPPKGPPKLESSLWRLVEAERRGGAPELSAEAQRSAIALRDGVVRVIIEAQDGRSASAIASARSFGAMLETSYGDLVQVVAPVATLEPLADDASVRYVRQPTRYFPAVITGEGVGLVNADDWHAAGVGGSAVKVAVLDGGFSGYSSLLGSELPSSVTTQSFRADGRIDLGFDDNPTVHGTAVAAIVHEMAPDAQLYLVNFQTDPELANAVSWIVGQGVDVINFSIGCSVCAPGDGTGFENDLVSSAVSSGILWSNAAGNEAQNHWTGMWSDPDADGWLNFSGTDESNAVILYAGEAMWIEMKWTDSWPAGCRDYDLAIFDSASNLVAYSVNVQDCFSTPPVEGGLFVAPYDDTFHVTIPRYSATGTPRFHLYWTMYPLYLPWPTLQYVVASRSLSIPADNPDAVSVGAVDWSTPSTIEPFSSQGPTEDGRTKPDLVAPDYVSGATYGPSGFPGTSAASPHVAGAAALVKQAYPSYTPSQIKSFLEGRAVELGAAGKDNVYGSGRLDLGSIDGDGDGVIDPWDNCPSTSNPNQLDRDGDGNGDACDVCTNDPDNDADKDGICAGAGGYLPPKTGNNDNCPSVSNPDQADNDDDGPGDACDPDDDNDGICDPGETDASCSGSDNCQWIANPGQEDTIHPNGTGDHCDDPDGDGFADYVEAYLGTDPDDACPDSPSHDAWPLDIDMSTDIDVSNEVFSYVGRIGATPGDPLWWQRLDLDMSGYIDVSGDVFMYVGRIGEMCT